MLLKKHKEKNREPNVPQQFSAASTAQVKLKEEIPVLFYACVVSAPHSIPGLVLKGPAERG